MLTIITGFHLDKYTKDLSPFYIHPAATKHPSEQSELGYVLASECIDVDCTIISNSDHILNGARRAVRHNDAKIRCIFINKDGDEQIISCNECGRLNPCPEGFFDQIEKDLRQL